MAEVDMSSSEYTETSYRDGFHPTVAFLYPYCLAFFFQWDQKIEKREENKSEEPESFEETSEEYGQRGFHPTVILNLVVC